MTTLHQLLAPRAIAIIGASADLTRAGSQTMEALAARGYAGGIYPVNPKYEEVGGRKSYASIADVPKPCDAAVIALPAALVPDAVAACGDAGVPLAVILGSGFRESGAEGEAIEARLLEIAREKGVRLIGPNCLGFINIPERIYAGFGSLSRPPLLPAGTVSAVIQSGGFGNSLTMRCGAAGIGFRTVVASGNETDLNTADFIDAFVDDPGTRVILVYMEGVRDGRAFIAAARRALAAGKPLVVWKAGNSGQGLRAAASHTANMTGAYDVFRAAFRQCGVIEVDDVDMVVSTLTALLAGRVANGRRIAVMSGSGGSAVVFSDAADKHKLAIDALSAETQAVLAKHLPSIAVLDNPVDYAAGFMTPANGARFQAALDALVADPDIDQVVLMLATVVGDAARAAATAISEVFARSPKPIFIFWASPREASLQAYEILEQAGVPVLRSPGHIAAVMGLLADWQEARARDSQRPAEAAAIPLPDELARASGVLDEHLSKKLVAAFGIRVTQDQVFPAAPIDTGGAATRFPVAVKIVSPDIAHKSDAGGVRLNVQNAGELAQASRAILEAVSNAAPNARLSGLLVSEMVEDGLEVILGVIDDKAFGPVVALGLGGIFAEVLHDITYRVAPFGRDEANTMISELRSTKMFEGVRGRAPRDTGALADALVALSSLAWQLRGRLVELDINPLLVLAEGRGAVAADALAVLGTTA